MGLFVKRIKYSSGTTWEPTFGYSRAYKVGQFVFISGTTGTDENSEIVGVGDPYVQTKQTILNIEKGLLVAYQDCQVSRHG